tara:strand:- start:290 stop:484 length:195 start_codon:yes stop_codon:yes gene_type:complete
MLGETSYLVSGDVSSPLARVGIAMVIAKSVIALRAAVIAADARWWCRGANMGSPSMMAAYFSPR